MLLYVYVCENIRRLKSVHVFCQNIVNIINRKSAVYFVINGKHRRKTAGTYASCSVKREFAVSSTFAYINAESLFNFFDYISAALNIARSTKTDCNLILSLGIN